MSWRCFFGHDFKEEDRRTTYVWGSSKEYPQEIYTDLLLKCSRCEERKVLKVDGNWDRDDDDDDRDPPPQTPQMSPDDFYEKVCKE